MKKILVLLLVLALFVTAGIIAVSADAQANADAVYCERCKKDIPAAEWMEWTATGGDVNKEGHYYLADTFTAQESTVKIPALKFVCLDLRGNTWITKDIRTLMVAGDLSILDTVGGGRILTTGANGVAGGFALVERAGALNLFGGTVQFVPRDDIMITYGGLIVVDAGVVNLDGATVTGGLVAGTSSTNIYGGNFYLTNGAQLNVIDGVISRGIAADGKNKQGGNIYANSASTITISGGVVEEGYAATDGGNIFTAGATLRISGGVIRNGVSPNRGGNIGAVTSEVNLIEISGGTITGGVSGGALKDFADTTEDDTLNPTVERGANGGSNIYGRTPSGSLVITGGTIDGDILLDYMGTLTLSGSPKINLGKSNGLRINNNGIKADVSGLQEGAMIYVQANSVFTKALSNEAAANAALSYFRGAVRSNISVNGSYALTCSQGTQGYCPHCGELVTWTAGVNATSDGQHIYLSGSSYGTKNLIVQKDMVLDLNGYSLNRDGARVIVGYDCTSVKTLSVLDSWGGGKMEGTRIANSDGGILYIYANGALELYSGTIRTTTSVKDSTAANVVANGGVIYSAGNVTLHGGRITGGITGVTSEKYGGGNILMTGTGKKLTINGGLIQSGNYAESVTLKGGNIYSAGIVEIKGGYIMGGKSTTGGNIYSAKEVKMTGGVVWAGTSINSGGNIYANKFEMSGGLIGCGESTAGSGGNLRLGDADAVISGNAVILSGKADSNAGNIYCVQAMTLDIEGGLIAGGQAANGGNLRQNAKNCELNISGGVIVMGTVADDGDGGNFYINNGTCTMTGGVVAAGYASDGGNFYFNKYVYAFFKDDGDSTTPVPVVSYGTAYGGNGGNIYFNSDGKPYYMQLGNCDVHGGYSTRDGNNIYLGVYATIEILPEFAQDTTIYFDDSFFAEDGISLDDYSAYCNGVFPGALHMENDESLPKIITSASNPTLVIGQAALVMQDGSVLWFGSNEDAMAAYTDQVKYIQPDNGDLNLPSGEYIIDLAGADVVVKGDSTASFYCFDTVNVPPHNFWGTVTVMGPKLLNEFTYTVDGKLYLMIEEDYYDMYSFHRLDMEVISASVRPDTEGFYYTSKYTCDTKIFELVESFGIAVSVKDMPGADFATDPDTLYTELSVSELGTNDEFNSVIINNILKAEADNGTRGTMGIYGMPYMVIGDGSEDGEKRVVVANGVCYSLKDVLALVDENNYYANKPMLESFYQKWEGVMKNWGFTNIGVKPQDDDTFRILMIGNSFCSYYTGELYGLLMENLPEGVTSVEVYNLYASGRTMTAHYNLWVNGSAGDYDLFRADKDGRYKLQPNGGWTLEDALAYANWDCISLQGKPSSGSYATEADLDPMCEELNRLATPLFGRIHEMFPYTRLYWHRTWNQEVGRVTDSGFVYTEDYNSRYDPGMQYVCDYMTEVFDQDKPYDLIQVNSGAAWTEARRLNETLDLLPYGGLCAGNGRNTFGDGRANSGDGQHDGDIGGGQMLNAYMWYMTITGDGDLSDNNYKPDYELSDDLINMLKQAAMTIYNAAE